MIETKVDFVLTSMKIETIVGKYVILKTRWANYLGLCPFHDEKTPSFVVSSTKQIYKCFGCGKSGNSISFISDLKKLSIEAAADLIIQEFELELPDGIIKSIETAEIYAFGFIIGSGGWGFLGGHRASRIYKKKFSDDPYHSSMKWSLPKK